MISSLKTFLTSVWFSFQFTSYPALLNYQMQLISSQIKIHELSKQVYAEKYKSIVPLMVLDDAVASDNEDAPSKKKQVSTSQVMSTVSSDMGAEFETMLLKILIESKQMKTFKETESSTNAETIFHKLLVHEDHIEDDLKFDSLIVKYAMNRAFSFSQSNKNGLYQWAEYIGMIRFFEKHIEARVRSILSESKTSRSTAIAKAKTFFDVYGPLSFLPFSKDWLINKAYPLIYLATTSELNLSGLRLKMEIQSSYMRGASISSLDIDDLMETADTLVANLDRFRIIDPVYFGWFDLFNIYVDKYISTKDYLDMTISLLDKKWSINHGLSRKIVSLLRQQEIVTAQLKVLHPVLQTHLDQALAEAEKERAMGHHSSSNLNFDTFVASKTDEMVNKFGLSLNESQKTSLSATYHSLFIKIELGRAFLESKDTASRPTELIAQGDLRAGYKKLRRFLEMALSIRFERKELGPEVGLIPVLTGKIPYVGSDHIYIRDFANQMGSKEGTMVFSRPGHLVIEPGIYFADGPSILNLDEVEFHPLAMIYSQGHDIEIRAQSLDHAWIDSSGLDQRHDRPSPPNDGLPSSPNGAIKGTQPSKPMDADNGESAGTIVIKSSLSKPIQIRNSIFVSFGGDGENGFSGAPSPNCDQSGNYQEVVHKWTKTIGRTPKNCLKCRLFSPLCLTDWSQGQICGWQAFTQSVSDTLSVKAGPGGKGGNGGDGGPIRINSAKQSSVFVNSITGMPGLPGLPGACGPQPHPTESGRAGALGKSYYLESEIPNE